MLLSGAASQGSPREVLQAQGLEITLVDPFRTVIATQTTRWFELRRQHCPESIINSRAWHSPGSCPSGAGLVRFSNGRIPGPRANFPGPHVPSVNPHVTKALPTLSRSRSFTFSESARIDQAGPEF